MTEQDLHGAQVGYAEQLTAECVTQHVRIDTAAQDLHRGIAYDVLDLTSCEAAIALRGVEYRLGSGAVKRTQHVLVIFVYGFRESCIDRHRSLLVVFGDVGSKYQAIDGPAVEKKMRDLQLDNFTDTKAGIEHKAGDEVIAETFMIGNGCRAIIEQAAEEFFLLVNIESAGCSCVAHSVFPPELHVYTDNVNPDQNVNCE